MSAAEEIVRIAAKGDGQTASGKFARQAAPGDVLLEDGSVQPGPHHVSPPCRHFGKCGGCQLQHCDEETLAQFVQDRVENAAKGQGLAPARIGKVHLSPPGSRRRASFRAINGGTKALVGYNEAGSHRVIDLKECPILHPDLFAAKRELALYFSRLKGKFAFGIELSLVDQGVDCLVSGFFPDGLEQTEDLLALCSEAGFARLSLDQGYGAETFWEPEPATVTFGNARVSSPAGAFLQATRDGELALVGAAQEWLAGSIRVADLFAGLGTFAFNLAQGRRVTAFEADQAGVLACRSAAASSGLAVDTVHRDLFRNPVRAEELALFDALLLDPPRAGSKAQIEQIAASGVGRVVYVSCNPSSWSRDAAALVNAGYELAELRPVGQFRWSTHVELASLFVKHG